MGDPRPGGSAGFGDVVETAAVDALDHVSRSRTDGAGRRMARVDTAQARTHDSTRNTDNSTGRRVPVQARSALNYLFRAGTTNHVVQEPQMIVGCMLMGRGRAIAARWAGPAGELHTRGRRARGWRRRGKSCV
jgi:hypothetical protein